MVVMVVMVAMEVFVSLFPSVCGRLYMMVTMAMFAMVVLMMLMVMSCCALSVCAARPSSSGTFSFTSALAAPAPSP
jgi:hypothetical protein